MGKWNNATGRLIVRIIPGAYFCPNYVEVGSEFVICFDYGKSLLRCIYAIDDYSLLKELFKSNEAMVLLSLAMVFSIKEK